jgi:hypothetical protein
MTLSRERNRAAMFAGPALAVNVSGQRTTVNGWMARMAAGLFSTHSLSTT